LKPKKKTKVISSDAGGKVGSGERRLDWGEGHLRERETKRVQVRERRGARGAPTRMLLFNGVMGGQKGQSPKE